MLQLKSAFAKSSPLFKSLSNISSASFGGIGSKRKPTRRDLDKYEVVIVGGNLGAIFSRHLDDDSHGKYSTMVVFDQTINQSGPLRLIYEQQRCAKTDYLINAKLAINMYTASEVGTVEKFLPEENAIVLKSGRKIGYNQLVVAMGLKGDVGLVPGLEEAWADVEHPVYMPIDHPSWRSFHHPYPRWHYNFTNGDAFFCIPPYPYAGEVGGLNFFVSTEVWRWHLSTGKLSPKHSFTVINANDTFCKHHEETDKFIKDKIQKLGIKVDYGWNLKSIDKTKKQAVFENLKTGQKETRGYGQLYTLVPTRPHDSLVEAGLATRETGGLLDVDRATLQHKKYKNIFGLGDVNNIPTTKTFYGGFHQIHVVRHNIQRNLKGQSLNARYSGYSKSPIYLGQNSITYSVHYYDQKASWSNLIDRNGGPISNLRYYFWGKQQKKRIFNWYLKKSWGPPTFKLKRTFRGEPAPEGTEGQETQPIFQAVKRAVQETPSPVAAAAGTGVAGTETGQKTPSSSTTAGVETKQAPKEAKTAVEHEQKAGEEIRKSADKRGVVTDEGLKKASEEVKEAEKVRKEEKKKEKEDKKKQ